MATMRPIYIPSTTPGKTWNITAGKDNYRREHAVGAYATEGELEDGAFTFTVFQDRTMKHSVPGIATAKNIALAVEGIKAKLKAAGFIA